MLKMWRGGVGEGREGRGRLRKRRGEAMKQKICLMRGDQGLGGGKGRGS